LFHLSPRIRALSSGVALVTLAVLPRASVAQKTDTLLLNNGDRIIGEVSVLENGLLEYKTDNVGTINVKWDRVVRLTSRLYFEVETRTGRRYFGTFAPIDTAGYLAVALDRVEVVPLADVVGITRIKQTSFFDRIDGYLDLGFSYAKANKTVQLTSGLEATYLLEHWSVSLNGDLFIQSQNAAERTRRWSLASDVQRQLARQKRWLVYMLGQLQQNQELGLDLRTLISPGGGRELFRTNSHEANAFLGLAYQREWYRDSTGTGGAQATDNLEASLAGDYRAFRYDWPELDASANLQIYPSLTDLGRVRLEGDLRTRYEVLKDFFVTLAFEMSYDSRPPSPDTPTSDFTTTLSLTWKF
jgi:putative salt-induced outer membrane protein YdiY